MEAALEDVRFLARSANRATVLTSLAAGPKSRDDLLADLDASRVTLRRILGELEERGWVERGPDGFATTAVGEAVATEFERLTDAMAAIDRLEPVMEWVPTEAVDFDLGHLADATVTVPDGVDSIAPVVRVDETIREASEAAILTAGVSASTVATNRDAVVKGGQDLDLVLGPAAHEVVRDNDEVGELVVEMLATGRATVHVATEPVPEAMVAVLDGTVVLGLLGDGLPRGVVESDDPVVVEWARSLVDEYRERGEPVTASDLAADG